MCKENIIFWIKISITLALTVLFVWNLICFIKEWKTFNLNMKGFEDVRNENIKRTKSFSEFIRAVVDPQKLKENDAKINEGFKNRYELIQYQDQKVEENLKSKLDTRREIFNWTLRYLGILSILWLGVGTQW